MKQRETFLPNQRKMILCFLSSSVVLLSLVHASSMGGAMAYEIAKPGCPDECGGVKIPYPFGIGEGCYFFSPSFSYNGTHRIKCDNTTNPPVPFLFGNGINSKVVSIDYNDHSIRVSSGVAYQCYQYGDTVPSTAANYTYNLPQLWPFNISATRNTFVAIGCDTTGQVRGQLDGTIGCTTSCGSWDLVRNGACSGRGCCQTSIFNTMFNPSIFVGSVFNYSDFLDGNSYGSIMCSYAFVGEVGSYKFTKSNLAATAEHCNKIQVPVVYDWSVNSFLNCSEARKARNVSLVCGSNTKCVDGDNDGWFGYRCQCLEGYTGNPYLSHGCEDINECVDERLNHCKRPGYCVNTGGGYDCQCPEGYHGSGTQTSPCISRPGAIKLIFGLSIGMGLVIGFVILYGLYKVLKRRKEIKSRQRNFKKNGGLLLRQEMSTNEGAIDRTKIFSRSELEKATDNFNENRVLGRGGQGTVYKGMLVDGTIVAVKKSKKVDEDQLAQFINEVVILSQINHRNIVKLFGCCLETEVPLLVYEFIPKGTLYQHIHHPTEDFHMTWRVRFQIAVECARAVAYLHSSCSSPIYHRDIKSSNILLDEKYKAKVADFGTSRSISIDKTHVTTCVQGTFGYLDPEFFRSSQFSDKSDVYSFGVVLLELLTSKKPIFTNTSREPRGLATEFIQLMETSPNQLNNILDAQVLQHCSEEEIETLAKLVEGCLSLNGKQRPTMSEVVMTLEMIKKQHVEEGNPATDQQGIRRQVEVSLQPSLTTGSLTCSTSTSTSAITDNSYSMDVEPLLFESY